MTEAPSCTIDPERPCRSCLAEGPWACPYPYLLAGDELVDDGHPHAQGVARTPAAGWQERGAPASN